MKKEIIVNKECIINQECIAKVKELENFQVAVNITSCEAVTSGIEEGFVNFMFGLEDSHNQIDIKELEKSWITNVQCSELLYPLYGKYFITRIKRLSMKETSFGTLRRMNEKIFESPTFKLDNRNSEKQVVYDNYIKAIDKKNKYYFDFKIMSLEEQKRIDALPHEDDGRYGNTIAFGIYAKDTKKGKEFLLNIAFVTNSHNGNYAHAVIVSENGNVETVYL